MNGPRQILVTGGLGFLGSHLLEQLAIAVFEMEGFQDGGLQVYVVDNRSSSIDNPGQWFEALQNTFPHVFFHFLPTTVRDFFHLPLPPYFPSRFDQVYHLASVVGPAGVIPHRGQIVSSVVNDTYAMADACLNWGARLIDVSTSEVYGGGVDGECDESMPCIIGPQVSARSEYAVAKLAAETALINMAQADNLDVSIVRPFNIAGPRQRADGGFVLPRFCQQALTGQPLTIFGEDGMATRAFTDVRDIARGLICAMEGGARGEVYNLGNPANRITIGVLATEVLRQCGFPALKHRGLVTFIDPRDIYGPEYASAPDKFPVSEKARDDLGWAPQYGIPRIVEDTLRWEAAHGPCRDRINPTIFNHLLGPP